MKNYYSKATRSRFFFAMLQKNLFALILLMAMQSFGQENNKIKSHISFSSQSLHIGEKFSMNILISGSNDATINDAPAVEGLAIKLNNEGPLNNNGLKGYAITYDIIAQKSGSFIIPPLEIDVDNQSITTHPIEINIKEPKQFSGVDIAVTLDKKECFVGEAITLQFTWTSSLPFYDFRAVNIDLPLLTHPSFRSFDTIDQEIPENIAIGIPISNSRIIAKRSRFTRGNKLYDSLTFTKVIQPQTAGEFHLDPTLLLCSYLPQKIDLSRRKHWKPQYPSYFSNDFFSTTDEGQKYERIFAKSKKLKLVVKELPTEGRPANFNGLIGNCFIETQASPTILHAGDPLTLKATISGHPFPQIIDFPNLEESLPFKRSFSLTKRNSSPRYDKKTVQFVRTLRPSRAGSGFIPRVEIPFFDPESQTYKIATSKEIPITVKESQNMTAFDAELSGDQKLENSLEANPEGIRHNNISNSALENQILSPKLAFLLAIAIPAILFLLFYIFSSEKRLLLQDPIAYKKRRAYKNFCHRNRTLERDNVIALNKSVRQYFAEKFNLVTDAHTIEEILHLLKGFQKIDKQTALLSDFYQKIEALQHAAKSDQSPTVDFKEINLAIAAIDKEIKNA